jgi:sugar/nucleoside kinase (ribokinase family)
MITGVDISSEILAEIRNNYKGNIYLDLHSLSRGFDQSNNRVFRTINDSDKWLNNVDVLQCSQNELKTLYKSVDQKEIIEKVLSTNTKYLVITKGEKGSELYSTNYFLNEEAVKFSTISNSVGCGDIFGAVFFSSYISTNNIEFSLREGVKISSNFTQFKNVYEFLDKGIDLV